MLVPPVLAQFCDRHPAISIDLVVTSTAVDLSRREADIALRVTDKAPDTSVGRRVCEFRFCVYASRRYLEKNKDRALQDHRWVLTDTEIDWLIPLIWRNRAQASERIVFSSSLTLSTVTAGKEGMGVVLLPCFLGDAECDLVRVTDPPDSLAFELWVLTHPDLRHTARIIALMAYLRESLEKKKDLISGIKGRGTRTERSIGVESHD